MQLPLKKLEIGNNDMGKDEVIKRMIQEKGIFVSNW